MIKNDEKKEKVNYPYPRVYESGNPDKIDLRGEVHALVLAPSTVPENYLDTMK